MKALTTIRPRTVSLYSTIYLFMSLSQSMVPLEAWSFIRSLSVPSRDILSYDEQGGEKKKKSLLSEKNKYRMISLYRWNENQPMISLYRWNENQPNS